MINIYISHFANKTDQLPFISEINSGWTYFFSRDFKFDFFPLNRWLCQEMYSEVPIQSGTHF